MIKSNYHIHSTYCDGKNTLAEMAASAYQNGLESIGFTSHFVTDYPEECAIAYEDIKDYLKDIKDLKKIYTDKMDVFASFEFDYYMHNQRTGKHYEEIIDSLDYTILSIHTMGFLPNGEMAIIDADKESFKNGVNQLFDTPEDFIKAYYSSIGEMALKYRPDIIGHIDLIKKNNDKIFDEESTVYKEAVGKALDKIKQAGSIVEINTGGAYRYGRRCLYPSQFILEEIKKREIPITVNGDTHFADGINYMFDEVAEWLKLNGFATIRVFDGKEWVERPI